MACDEPHDGETILAADPWAVDAAFPGVAVEESTRRKCEAAFQTCIGVDHQRPVLDYTYGSPSAESWESGERRITCVAYDPKGGLSVPVRRSGR